MEGEETKPPSPKPAEADEQAPVAPSEPEAAPEETQQQAETAPEGQAPQQEEEKKEEPVTQEPVGQEKDGEKKEEEKPEGQAEEAPVTTEQTQPEVPTEAETEQAPAEPGTEQAPTEPQTQQEPVAPGTEQTPAEQTGTEQTPAEQTPAEPGTEQAPAEQTPAEPGTEQAPAEPGTEQAPAEPGTEQAPAEQAPAEQATEQAPAEPGTEQAPAEQATEQAPAEPGTEQAPAEQATEQAPAEQTPAEPGTEQAPAEPGTEQAEADQAPAEGQETVDGQEQQGEEGEDDEPKIPDDFYYDFDQFASKPIISADSGLPAEFLTLERAFGYDCTKRSNLHLLDEKTVVFAAGNYVQILDLQSKEQTFIRSTSGGGIGAVAVHPSRQFFAVAEKGESPNINLFEYPSLKLHRILRGGTSRAYSYVDFSPDGTLLASQGSDPDYMLTLWNWKQEKIVLRSKAFSQEVFRVTFSTELEGQLTTSGTVHIKFWKMADTFTGLKLQGELGKFGRTEITDIEGYVELPDGKVLSGTEWGNMLLWDGGLIKVEIQRKNKKSCHVGPIQQILLDEGELMTIGVDGFVRVWDFESVDTADSTDDTAIFEMEPMNELRVGSEVQLKSIVKSVDAENEPTIWYAQDAHGGIWRLDLSFSHTSHVPEKLFTYHAGPITGCDTSHTSQIAATTGADRTVRVFDYVQKKQLCDARFSAGGSTLLWAPRIVDPKGGTVFVGFEDGVVRSMMISQLLEDSHRKKKHHECSLELLQAFKPHNKTVTSIVIDGKGEIMATGSLDSTIFFMSIDKECKPIGFIKVPAPVHQLQWSPERFGKLTLLVFCEDGLVVELQFPEDKKFDTAHTFEILGIPMKTFKFRTIKSRLRHEEEVERKAKEEEERKKKQEEERRKRIERGLETESEQGEEEEEKTPEPEWSPFIPDHPSPILTGFYSEPGKFWLSMGAYDAGYLYECSFYSDFERARRPEGEEDFDEPFSAIPVQDSNDVPICHIKMSPNGKQALFGMEDGTIRIQNLIKPWELSELGPFWSLSVHDNNYGHITGLVESFDGKTLISAGADGNLFQFGIMQQDQLDKEIAQNKAKLPSAKKKEDDKAADDIDDPNAYSIEEAKQKAEHDKMMKEAEEKKKEVRQHVAKMRRMFKQLLEQNESLPSYLRLHKDEFEMDREIKEELERHKQEKIELVRRELAWESEKQRLALEKLRKRFKDVVECDRIVVKAFQTLHEVSSFRASKLSDDFYHLKADFERRRTIVMRDDMTRDPTRDILTGQTRMTEATGQSGDKQEEQAGTRVSTTLKGSMGERISKALYKVEEKKKKRAARRAQWEELYATKPDDDYEDPEDVAAIKDAKDHMGDYKLKTAKDYVVPDHLRMNVDKARGRLLILKDLIHENKYDFNQKLLTMRDDKIKVIEEIADLVTQLREVQEKLDSSQRKPVPQIPEMHPEEMPEKKLEYTRETLLAFKKQMAEKKEEKKGGDSGGFGGFGGFGGGDTPKAPEKPPSPIPMKKQSTVVADQSEESVTEVEEEELSPLEINLRQANNIRLCYQQDFLLKQIKDLVTRFDAELRLLRHDKFKLDIIMKNADLRQVTLFEELVLLKEFEKREDVLAEKVTSKQQEKLDMQAKILDVQSKLETKKKDIEKYQEKEKALNVQFNASLGDNKFSDYLTKVFKKRIKRSKKKVTEGEDDDDESDEDSDEDSDWDEDEDDDESEMGGYDLDICPPGCDQNLYDATCQLREKRLDIEEALTEEKKSNETLKKELDALQKKARVIDSSLKSAQQDLEAFQLEKQQKLNELDVVVSLKLHQIQYMLNGILPQDLSQTLVFESNGVVRLQQRIKELEHEKHSQKKYMRESKKKHVQLIKDRKVLETKSGAMEETCGEMMIAKFGCLVDLEKLETVTVNRGIEELKEKLRMIEIQCAEEVAEWDETVAEKKTRITELIRENTKRLDQLSMLVTNRKSSEGALNSRQKSLGEEYSGQRKADVRERQRLIQLVQLQAQEIEALKEEIMLLSRKGGHILPPAQPPLPQSPQMRTMSN